MRGCLSKDQNCFAGNFVGRSNVSTHVYNGMGFNHTWEVDADGGTVLQCSKVFCADIALYLHFCMGPKQYCKSKCAAAAAEFSLFPALVDQALASESCAVKWQRSVKQVTTQGLPVSRIVQTQHTMPSARHAVPARCDACRQGVAE